jgi:hypothetical protein
MIKFIKGESVTITLVFSDTYDVVNLTSLKCFIDTIQQPITPIPTDNPRVFRVELGSQVTKRLGSSVKMEFEILDVVMGYKRSESVMLSPAIATGQPTTNAFNTGSDATVNLIFTENGITTDVTLGYILRGFSAYEIAVRAGFAGTESQWLTSITNANVTDGLIVAIDISEKGNGEVVAHAKNSNLRILTFYDDNDNGRQRNDFYASTPISTSQFTLSNDFSNDKFTGTLLCVKY